MSVHDMAGHLIRRLHQQSTQVFVQHTQAAGFDLTPVQYATIETIYENPGIDQARVAEMIGYDRATIGGVIERLEKKDWISREVSEQDRRARVLSLTSQGKKIRAALEPIVKKLQKDILHPLGTADQARFIELARKAVWTAEEASKT